MRRLRVRHPGLLVAAACAVGCAHYTASNDPPRDRPFRSPESSAPLPPSPPSSEGPEASPQPEAQDQGAGITVAGDDEPGANGVAVELLSAACKGGDQEGCTGLGVIYWQGNLVPKDRARARRLLQGACDQGDANGCKVLRDLSGLYR